MLITMYAAAKSLDLSSEAIRKKQNIVPRPGYFVDIAGGVRIDDDHPEWKSYVDNVKLRNRINGATFEAKEKKLFTAVYNVIRNSFDIDQDKLMEILNKIESEYEA